LVVHAHDELLSRFSRLAGPVSILLLAGGLDALQNGAILAATPFAILMCLMCWCLYKTLRRDYREERQQVQEIMAHDQNVEKQQMEEIMRRHEAGEPVGQAVSDSTNGASRKGS
jgi:choline-glycine betaine transporter